ncbi:hypothetical protein G6F68_013570 [Rhizopus microsporus]|nr:hypothetical protein G6F68_013570 [Rhizopus microsporus]
MAVAQRAQPVQLAVLADGTGDGVARAHQDQRVAGIVLSVGGCRGQLVRRRAELAIPDAATLGQRLEFAAHGLHALAKQLELQLWLRSGRCVDTDFLHRRSGRGGQQLAQRGLTVFRCAAHYRHRLEQRSRMRRRCHRQTQHQATCRFANRSGQHCVAP